MKKIAVVLLAVLLLASSLHASFFRPFEKVHVSRTEHFDFIYSDETRASAALLASKAEDIYDALALFASNPSNKRFPVVVTGREESINAYFTPDPSARIIMYDTLDVPNQISFYENEFISIFTHELAHAMSITNLEGVYRAVALILGDPLNLHYLNGRALDFEGFAVMSESVTGQGRLNDPFENSLIVTSRAEGSSPSLFDAEANSSYWYLYGAPFTAYTAQKYGNDLYNRYFIRGGKLNPIPFFTTFGASKASVFNEYLSSVPVPSFAPDTIIKSDISRLYSTEDGILGLGYGTFYSIEDDRVSRYASVANAVDRNGSITTVLDIDTWSRYRFFDGKKPVRTDENTLSLFKHEMGEYTALINEGQTALLKRGDELIFSTANSIIDAELYHDEVVLAEYDGKNIILAFTSSGKEYVFPDDILIKHLSVNGNKVAFAWGRRSEPYGLTRLGWFEEGTLHLSSDQHLGGVTYPVLADDGSFYFISEYTKRYNLKKAEIGECEEIVLTSRDIRNSVLYAPGFESEKTYHPISYLWRGTLMPTPFDDLRPFLGLSFVTSDPAGKLSLYLSGTFDTGLISAGLSSSAGSYYNRLSANYDSKENTLTLKHSIGKQKSLFPSFFGLSISSAGSWVCYSPVEDKRNRLTLEPSLSLYWNRKFGAGYYDKLSFGAGLDYIGILHNGEYSQDWGSFAYLRFPLLFFLDKDPRLIYDLPLRLSAAIGSSSGAAFDASADLMLFGIRLDKGIPYTGLTLNRAYLVLGAGATVPRPSHSMDLISDVRAGYPDTVHHIALSAGAVLSSVIPTFSGSEIELYFEVAYEVETNSFTCTVDFRNPF